MNRRSLGAVAIVILLLMVIVATAGLDNLPRDLRKSVTAAATQLDTDRKQFVDNRDFVTHALAAESLLFRAKAASYEDRLQRDSACLATAATEARTLEQLAKANRRSDTAKVQAELAKFQSARSGCVEDAKDLRAEAQRWINYKHELPQRLAAMQSSYQAVQSFDVDAALAPAKKAEIDWPAKREDIDSRATQLKALKSDADQAWQSTEKLRADAAANHLEDFDYGTFFQAADRIDNDARSLKEGANSANQLAAQLYTSWDKLLLDVDDNHGVREKFRIVRTKYKDATLAGGEASSEERWEEASAASVRNAEKNVGMVVARKPAGKYDSEVESVVQPPAIAYVAPPGQSNAYGSWTNGVWTWLPQYLILRSLLNASQGPITYGDYNGWQSARRGGYVYYGREGSGWWHSPRSTSSGGGILGRARDWANSRSPSSGGSGTDFYKERPKTYGSSGGYSSSQYKSRGSFSGSRYQSRGGFGSFSSGSRGFGGSRSFGRGGRR